MTWPRKLTLGALLIAVALGLFEWATWPDAAKLARDNPETTAFIRSYENARQRQEREGHDAAADWRWVPYDRISRHLMRAVLVAEDINFFSHGGFETRELKLALAETIREGKPLRGASTLSQQLVKNLWLTPSRNPCRKVKEALITSQLERELTKRRILELYLNVVEFGPGIYGAEAAAQRFFRRPASRLSKRQAAALAAGLPSSTWYPGSDSRRYQDRVARTLRRMAKATWIADLL